MLKDTTAAKDARQDYASDPCGGAAGQPPAAGSPTGAATSVARDGRPRNPVVVIGGGHSVAWGSRLVPSALNTSGTCDPAEGSNTLGWTRSAIGTSTQPGGTELPGQPAGGAMSGGGDSLPARHSGGEGHCYGPQAAAIEPAVHILEAEELLAWRCEPSEAPGPTAAWLPRLTKGTCLPLACFPTDEKHEPQRAPGWSAAAQQHDPHPGGWRWRGSSVRCAAHPSRRRGLRWRQHGGPEARGGRLTDRQACGLATGYLPRSFRTWVCGSVRTASTCLQRSRSPPGEARHLQAACLDDGTEDTAVVGGASWRLRPGPEGAVEEPARNPAPAPWPFTAVSTPSGACPEGGSSNGSSNDMLGEARQDGKIIATPTPERSQGDGTRPPGFNMIYEDVLGSIVHQGAFSQESLAYLVAHSTPAAEQAGTPHKPQPSAACGHPRRLAPRTPGACPDSGVSSQLTEDDAMGELGAGAGAHLSGRRQGGRVWRRFLNKDYESVSANILSFRECEHLLGQHSRQMDCNVEFTTNRPGPAHHRPLVGAKFTVNCLYKVVPELRPTPPRSGPPASRRSPAPPLGSAGLRAKP